MTAKELIEILRQYPPDMPVVQYVVHNGRVEHYAEIRNAETEAAERIVQALGTIKLKPARSVDAIGVLVLS